MKLNLLQISDLHFGRTTAPVSAALKAKVAEIQPDYLIIVGDLTQRNFHGQFQAAQEFLTSLNRPIITIPGNHDLHYFNLWQRFFHPHERYEKYIGQIWPSEINLSPWHFYPLYSINPWSFHRGKISQKHWQKFLNFLKTLDADQKVAVLIHHPGLLEKKLPLIPSQDRQKIRLALSGHTHIPAIHQQEKTVFVVSGTSISSRLRGKPNSFQQIQITEQELTIHSWFYQNNSRNFQVATEIFQAAV